MSCPSAQTSTLYWWHWHMSYLLFWNWHSWLHATNIINIKIRRFVLFNQVHTNIIIMNYNYHSLSFFVIRLFAVLIVLVSIWCKLKTPRPTCHRVNMKFFKCGFELKLLRRWAWRKNKNKAQKLYDFHMTHEWTRAYYIMYLYTRFMC